MIASNAKLLILNLITITGPESSGKSQLTLQLAEHFQCPYIPEHARAYLNTHGNQYLLEDLYKIADIQTQHILKSKKEADQSFLFADSDALTVDIWAKRKFDTSDPYFQTLTKSTLPRLYLLCFPDLDWQEDPLREDPHTRHEIFIDYETEILNLDVDYIIVSGKGEARLQKVIHHLENTFL